MDKKILNNLISFITIVVIGVATVFVLSKINPKKETINKNDIIKEVQTQVSQDRNKPSEFVDYKLLDSFHSFSVVKNQVSYASSSDIIGRVKKTVNSKGQFSRMYILIKASVDTGKPLSVYDDIWLTFNYNGGHVPPNNSLPTPPDNISVLLFSAKELPYKIKNTSEQKTLDVLSMFNNNKNLGVDIFLSTARKGGMINDFSIFYECESGSDCSIF